MEKSIMNIILALFLSITIQQQAFNIENSSIDQSDLFVGRISDFTMTYNLLQVDPTISTLTGPQTVNWNLKFINITLCPQSNQKWNVNGEYESTF